MSAFGFDDSDPESEECLPLEDEPYGVTCFFEVGQKELPPEVQKKVEDCQNLRLEVETLYMDAMQVKHDSELYNSTAHTFRERLAEYDELREKLRNRGDIDPNKLRPLLLDI